MSYPPFIFIFCICCPSGWGLLSVHPMPLSLTLLRYDIFVVELGLQLVSQNINAEQCAYAFAVFMKMTYPAAKPEVDYRIPTTATFKEWAELLYPIGVSVNRSRLDLAAEIYYHHDDSPRGGYSWHGSVAQATFLDAEGKKERHTIPLGIEVLKDGKHKTMADEGIKVMGPNLRKMCMVMSDAAALDVAASMYKAKADLLEELDGVSFTIQEREVHDTDFVGQCINHGGDNASKAHFIEITRALKPVLTCYNCATLIQHWMVTRLLVFRIKRHIECNRILNDDGSESESEGVTTTTAPTFPSERQFVWFFCSTRGTAGPPTVAEHRRKIWKGLLFKALTNGTGRSRFHAPMELESVLVNGGEDEVKSWKLTEPVHDVWALMRSMSNLISHQGTHSKYYLNEAKQMRIFWAKHELENGVNEDTMADVGLPAFANNRFGIRQELAFYLCVAWDSTMTLVFQLLHLPPSACDLRPFQRYLSKIRLFDPEYDANLLLQNTFALNSVRAIFPSRLP